MRAANPEAEARSSTRNRHFYSKGRHQRAKRSRDKTSDLSKYIRNLSDRVLTEDEVIVLSRGLNYIPNVQNPPDYTVPLDRLTRSLRVRFFFRNSTEPYQGHPFRKRSTWVPPPASQDIESYLTSLPLKLDGIPPQPFKINLNRREFDTLNALSNDPSIVIKKADKGSAIVVENTTDYIKDGLNHLSDTVIYKQIDNDPTRTLVDAINIFVRTLHKKGYIDVHTKDFLSFNEPGKVRTQMLYFLKKLHKNPIGVRPIVSGCGGPTENLSSFIDHFLQPLVPKTTSYTRDSKHILNALETLTLPQECILVTIDVSALYLNIPHEEGIDASIRHLFDLNDDSHDIPFPPQIARDVLGIILKHNYFQFSDVMFQQIQGTAMGTKMAPSYANLFMAVLETNFLNLAPVKPLFWKRFIDDVLCVWDGSQVQLDSFLSALNDFHDTIKFTYSCSTTEATFLDLHLYKGDRFLAEGVLDVEPHFKKTNSFQYVHFSSSHPRAVFKAVVKGEMIRLLRATSSESIYKSVQKKMRSHFRARHYPNSLVQGCFDEVPFSSRQQHLVEVDTPPEDPPLTFITNYNQKVNTRKLKMAITPVVNTLDTPLICYKRNKNLSNHLVRAKLRDSESVEMSTSPLRIPVTVTLRGSSASCGLPGCKCCRLMSKKDRIISNTTFKSFSLPANTNCNSMGLVYLLECKLCKARNQYVGQTNRTLKLRMSGHRAAYALQTKRTPLYRHFRKRDHDFERDASLSVLEIVPQPQLLIREIHWINTLSVRLPHGLNSLYS